MKRGRKPGALTELQVAQKDANRKTILRAARDVFARRPYTDVSIDEISREAGVSRFTFYKHFSGKPDVVSSLLECYLEALIDDYAGLARSRKPDTDQIVAWIEHIVELWRVSYRDFGMIAALLRQDPELMANRERAYSMTIARIGQTIPAFGKASTGDERARIRAYMLLVALEDLCYELVISKWQVDWDLAIRVLAEDFARFIAAHDEPSARDGARKARKAR